MSKSAKIRLARLVAKLMTNFKQNSQRQGNRVLIRNGKIPHGWANSVGRKP